MPEPVVGRASPFKARGPFRGIRAPFRGVGVWGRYPARTNEIRNSTMQGAVVGTPGTFPTNWTSGSAAGITASVAALGTDETTGLPYVEINYAGTASGTNFTPTFEALTSVVAAQGQRWSISVWMAFVGAGRPASTVLRMNERSAGGSLAVIDLTISPTTTLTRFSNSGTLSNASTAYLAPTIRLGLVNGAAYDFTIRYVGPQLERGSPASALIQTSGATASRVADVLAGAY
jgi:hypothetical protein